MATGGSAPWPARLMPSAAAASTLRAATRMWRSPRVATRLGIALILVAVAAAGFGRRGLVDLAAEDPARSVRRFATGAAEVEVTAQMPWSRVPAVLPGPADAWAGGSPHGIALSLQLPAPRALLLYVQTRRTRPAEIPGLPAPPVDSAAHLRVLVNGTTVGTFDAPGPGRPRPGTAPRTAARIKAFIPATALGETSPMRLSLVNDGGPGVALRRLRLVEARPSFGAGHLGLGGRFPAVSAAFLAVGLGLLLRRRLELTGSSSGMDRWRRVLGPGLGLVLLSLAVAAPSFARGIPRWAWLLLILSVLPLGRRRARPAAAPRSPKAVVARMLGSGLLGIAALAVSLVAGELALRAAFRDEPWARSVLAVRVPPAPAPPPAGPAGPIPGPALPRRGLNSLGFDEREFPLVKPAGVYRIAILGDSLAVSVPRAQRFGSVIAERLNARASRPVSYEALSFGQTGADTNKETEFLQRAVWRTDPDFVLLEWYVNDLENGDHSQRPEPPPLIPGESAPARWLRGLSDRTLLHWMLQQQFTAVQERLGRVETYPAYMHRLFGDPDGKHWEAAAHELRDFIGQCRAHRIPVAIALFPHLSAGLPAGAYEFTELHDQVLELCRQEAVPCVDLRSTFAAHRDYTSLWVHRFDPHPNARAHRLAAERLVEVLGPLWLDGGRARANGPAARGDGSTARQPRRRTGFRRVPIPSMVMLTTSPGASAQSSGTRMPVPVESTVPGGTGL